MVWAYGHSCPDLTQYAPTSASTEMASNSVGTLHDGAYVVSVTTGPSNQPGRITTASTYSTKPASSTYHSIVSGTIVSSDTTVLANSSSPMKNYDSPGRSSPASWANLSTMSGLCGTRSRPSWDDLALWILFSITLPTAGKSVRAASSDSVSYPVVSKVLPSWVSDPFVFISLSFFSAP